MTSSPVRRAAAIVRAVVVISFIPAGLLLATNAAGVLRYVAQDGSGEYTSIQQAILASSDGDEVIVAPGVYFERIDFHGRRIVVRSTDGPLATIIDADSTGTVVTMESNENRQTVLAGFTLRGGTGTRLSLPVRADGRGGEPNGVDADVRRLLERSNRGVTETDGPEPRSLRFGGGIFLIASSPVLRDLILHGNGADRGGGLWGLVAHPLVQDCRFAANLAGTGGGVLLEENSAAEFVGCEWNYNHAAAGAAVAAFWSPAVFRECRFIRNSAGEGGAFYIRGAPHTMTLQRSAFWGNEAGEGSVALVVDGRLSIENCTFAANGLVDWDPASLIFESGASGEIRRSIFAHDRSALALLCRGAQVTRDCNDFWPSVAVEGCAPGAEEFSRDPFFCDLERRDLRLREDSPCLPEASPCGWVGAYGAGCPSPAMEVDPR